MLPYEEKRFGAFSYWLILEKSDFSFPVCGISKSNLISIAFDNSKNVRGPVIRVHSSTKGKLPPSIFVPYADLNICGTAVFDGDYVAKTRWRSSAEYCISVLQKL